MKLITNQQVSELITTADAIDTMCDAFATIRQGAQQARVRTSASTGAGSVMLSGMGAILPATQQTGVPARAVSIDEAAQAGDVVLTVTRSGTPLFSGDLLKAGALVAAIGASKGNVRELDDRAIARAAALVVEWKPQAQQEAGDLLLCQPSVFDWNEVLELGQVVDGSSSYQRLASDIVVYKGIGVGLEDVALAGLVYRRACERFGW